MGQYISKSALVAWIKKKKIPFKRDIEDGNYPTYLCALMDFEDLLDTSEVKDVEYIRSDVFIEKALKFIKTNVDRIVNNQHGVCMGCMDWEFRNYMKGE